MSRRFASGGLRRLRNSAGFPNLPARFGAAAAGFGASPHDLHMLVLFAFCGTSVTNVGTDEAKLGAKPRISRQQNCACTTNWRALMTKADRDGHLGRIMCEAFIHTCGAPVHAFEAIFNAAFDDRIGRGGGGHWSLPFEIKVRRGLDRLPGAVTPRESSAPSSGRAQGASLNCC
jgi:hypothetical protein